MNGDFYWGLIIWLSGLSAGCALFAVALYVGLTRGWITINEERIAAPLSQGVCSKKGLRGGRSEQGEARVGSIFPRGER